MELEDFLITNTILRAEHLLKDDFYTVHDHNKKCILKFVKYKDDTLLFNYVCGNDFYIKNSDGTIFFPNYLLFEKATLIKECLIQF